MAARASSIRSRSDGVDLVGSTALWRYGAWLANQATIPGISSSNPPGT
jgi:hypothetical protein